MGTVAANQRLQGHILGRDEGVEGTCTCVRVSVHVYVCECVYVCIHVSVYAREHTQVCECACMHVSVSVHTCECIYTCACACECMHLGECARMRVSAHKYVSVHICT